MPDERRFWDDPEHQIGTSTSPVINRGERGGIVEVVYPEVDTMERLRSDPHGTARLRTAMPRPRRS
jgi:hypothetical protein